jgi:hypothetical protein
MTTDLLTPVEHTPERPEVVPSVSTRTLPLVIAAAAVPSILYVVFVAHFGRNAIYWDDWSLVPIVDGALHHHIDFSQLWAQHNENRLLVPYLLVAGIGSLSHLDTRDVLFASAALFVATFALLLCTYRGYAGRIMTPLQTLLLGCVWFSVADTENALWAFQIAWYLVLLCLVAMLLALSRPTVSLWLLGAAGALAVVASFSSLQGLILWPVGLLCILWRIRTRRRLIVSVALWVAAAGVTAAVYFHRFNFSATGGGKSGYALHHLSASGWYLLALVGNAFPTTAGHFGLHEVIGAVLLVMALLCLVRTARTWRNEGSVPLPAALIIFGLLFDATTTAGRASFGVAEALSARYTMANLLIVVAVAITVFALPGDRPAHRRQGLLPSATSVVGVGVVCLLLAQIVVSTDSGLQAASAWTKRMDAGDTVMVNLDRIPEPERSELFDWYIYPSFTGATGVGWVHMVKSDPLGEMGSGTAAQYRARALPGAP